MERKIIKNDLLSHKKFLITLIKIFNEIQQELKKIPNFDSRNVIQLTAIDENSVRKCSAQREIKKEQEVKLFKQTYEEITLINKKKPRARRSDMVMKFSMVSDILSVRIKEQLCVKGEAKRIILDNITKLKASFMTWGKNSCSQQKKSRIAQSNSLSKQTDKYQLKYIFSEVATTNATGNQSRAMSKYQSRDEAGTSALQHETKGNMDENGFQLNRNASQKRQRYTINYLSSEFQGKRISSAIKRYTKNFITTDVKDLETQHVEEDNIYKEDCENFVSKISSKQIQNCPVTKNVQWQQNQRGVHQQIEREARGTNDDDAETKKSAFYLSQNYIRSRKNIQNMTHFVNNSNKRSIITKTIINDNISNCQESNSSSSLNQDMIFFQSTQHFKSRKFLTRIYIPSEEFENKKIPKSEKSIPRRSTLNRPTINRVGINQKKPISKFHKQVQDDDLELIKLEKPPQLLKKQFTTIDQNAAEIALDLRAAHLITDGKPITQFYNQLGQIRKAFQKEIDPYYKDQSMFFHQQSLLWEQQKRRMQRVLAERNKQFYFREFQMMNTTTHRSQEEALKAIRDDLFNFTEKVTTKLFKNYKLDQIELVKDGI